MAEAIDFSKTQRIVLLVDLNPLFSLQNPNPYLTSILTVAKHILSFPPLFNSLFAFKLFFSSLSPLRSSSLLPQTHPSSLSFNRPSQTLISLSAALNSLAIPITDLTNSTLPRASSIADSLLQLVRDYSFWDSEIEDQLSSTTSKDFPVIHSNLFLLFSPICRSLSCLAEFTNLDQNDECLKNLDGFCLKFCEYFGGVNTVFVGRDIHLSWIDVKYEFECNEEEKVDTDESVLQLDFHEKGIRSLGWGFSSTESIVLGSTIIPFGLIYPILGVPLNFSNSNNMCKSRFARLSLEILDVSGKPLECNFCDIELLNLKISKLSSDEIMKTMEVRNLKHQELDEQDKFWSHLDDGGVKLHVKMVKTYVEEQKIEGFSRHFIVRSFFNQSKKIRKNCRDNEFFTNRVLQLLSSGGEFNLRNTIPIWQILLSFLYNEGYKALVQISNSNGDFRMGILKPFTAHLAVLSIADSRNLILHDLKVSISNGFVESQNEALSFGKRRKNKKLLNQELTWSSFCKAAMVGSFLDLVEFYFTRELNNSKKLKFLKCWMKQARKSRHDVLTAPQKKDKVTDEVQIETDQDSKQTMSDHRSTESHEMEERLALASCLENSEVFFSNIPEKIEKGLELRMDLQILAERVVNSSIHGLFRKFGTLNIDGDTPNLDESCSKTVGVELVKFLLREPKKLKEKLDANDPSFQSFDQSSSSSESIVREYEFQILLRMEILQSGVADSMEESRKQKLVKQICSLLEIIQYLTEGGFHGNTSLYDCVERIIKRRYSHTLEDIVHKIYEQMDLLPFGNEDESVLNLFNSEDSNQSWREKHEKPSVSAEDESNNESPNEEQALKLNEARERRERARRFGSFSNRIPELQRVWVPKQPKRSKLKPDLFRKGSKKKVRNSSYSVVCETPLTGNKRSRSCDHGSNSRSVSKALFQE